MLELEWEVTGRQEYVILRDYHVQTKDYSGIKFILENPKSGEVFSRILVDEETNNIVNWVKLKKGDYKYQATIVERGTRNRLIIETGVVKMEKPLTKKEVEYPAKKYIYQLM